MMPLATDELRELVTAVGEMAAAADDSDRIERLRQFEELKSALCAAQAAVAVDFDRSQRAAQAIASVPAAQLGRGVSSQIGLAMRISSWKAQRWLGWAKILTSELPDTYAQLRAGRTTEWRAMLVARETAVLSREHRATVDAQLAPRLENMGDQRVEREARAAAYRLDPAAALERARNAESDRRVGLRPAPDTMSRLSGLLPVAQGVATYAALKREADRLVGTGDARSRGQIMADTLVERVTGQARAEQVPVEINLVMTDQNLFNTDTDTNTNGQDEPGWLDGYGPVPARWARDLASGTRHGYAPRWIRRLYTRDAKLVGAESTRRLFTAGQQRFIRLRDQTCRTPWCDAPIRHADHVVPHSAGGRTLLDNGQGLCEACNYARQARHWHSTIHPDGAITTRTPTDHRYRSRPPRIAGAPRRSPMEQRLADWLAAAA